MYQNNPTLPCLNDNILFHASENITFCGRHPSAVVRQKWILYDSPVLIFSLLAFYHMVSCFSSTTRLSHSSTFFESSTIARSCHFSPPTIGESSHLILILLFVICLSECFSKALSDLLNPNVLKYLQTSRVQLN